MRRMRSSAIAAFLALAWVPAAHAATASSDHFSVAVSPSSVVGGAPSTFTVAISNGAASADRIGAANLTAPPGFQLTSATLPAGAPGTATVAGGVVQLRGLAVVRGSTLDVTVGADTACAPGSYVWGAAATNEPNFSGRSFTLETTVSHLATTVSAGCSLAFSSEPTDTVVGQPISAIAFTPSGPPVQVEILDGNGNLSTSSSQSVTVTLAANPGGGTLSGTTTLAAVGGVATFGNLSISQPGTGYTLEATSPGATSTTSTPFDETSAGTTCAPGQPSCETSADTSTSTLDLTAPATAGNTLSITVDPGTPLVCAGYAAQDPNWYAFMTSSTSVGKAITYTVVPAARETPVGFCLGAPYEFTTSGGTPAPPGTLPDGTSGFIGMLPRCAQGFGGPCVDSVTKAPDSSSPTGFDVTQKVNFPAGLPGDPWGRT
jgi:hypothetical protein